VRGRDLTFERGLVAEHAKRLERVRRKAHWDRSLGEGDRRARIGRDIDAAIVGELGIEDRGDAPEEGPARVGGELAEGYLAGRIATQKALLLRKRLA
jgi:hypothetical protein